MKKFPLIAAAAGTIVAASALGTQAMPAVPLSADMPVVHVAGGCGPGMHPNPWGRCVPNGYGRGPVVVGPGYRRGWDRDGGWDRDHWRHERRDRW